jgi:diguanylate cyclase (GGDEF)-like protein
MSAHRNRVAGAPPATELILLALVAGAVVGGFADADRAPLHLARVLALATLPAVLAIRSFVSPSMAARRGIRTPLWVASLAVLAALCVQATGGIAGVATPLAFLAIGAGSLTVGHRRSLPWAILLLIAVLVPGWAGLAAAASWWAQLGFGLGVLACAVIPGHSLSAERVAHDRTRARLRALENEAGGLRQESGQALPDLRGSYGHEERDRDLRTIARELQQDMDRACAVLVSATGATAAAVYRPDGGADCDRLVAVARAGDCRDLVPEVGCREGVFGAAFKAGTPVCLSSPRDDDPRIVHRSDPSGIGGVLALPLVDRDRRWGVVVLDAQDPETLAGPARELGGNVADFVARLIARAVDLTTVREGMRENQAFYEACRQVSRHVRIDDITEAVVRSAGAFVPLDACAVALCDETSETMRVIASFGFDPAPPDGRFFVTPSEGLLAQSVRHRTTIDRSDLAGADRLPLLFGQQSGPSAGLSSLLVLPIVGPGSGDQRPLGAMVVARRTLPDFGPEDAERLQVLLHQVGAALSNGRLFAEHESRSVTDGMTGLPNHRRFQEALASKLAGSGRTRLKISLLLMDIDKFKSVNDTYGHPMGDEVIRRLAGLLAATVRDGTDLAARYGGEEFCLVLEDTDAAGARVVADRLRESFRREVFVHRDAGKPVSFRCSVSIGIACSPDDATTQQELIDRADQALYLSKEGGRDRTTCYGAIGTDSLPPGRGSHPASRAPDTSR